MNSTQRVKLDTPIGSIESDSGNHLVDIATILFIVVMYFVIKKVLKS